GSADIALISQAGGMAELSLPYKFYGILAAGKPGIFVGPAESEIVGHYREADCGWQVQQGDVDALAKRLQHLADDSALRERMGTAARRLFDEKFTSDRAATAWIKLIEGVCHKGSHL